MLHFLKKAVDDASSDQRGKISAIYFLLLAINAAAWGFAVIALADRPTLGLLGGKLKLEGAFWDAVGGLNQGLANFGYLVVGVFIASWAISYLLYRWQKLDQPLVALASEAP